MVSVGDGNLFVQSVGWIEDKDAPDGYLRQWRVTSHSELVGHLGTLSRDSADAYQLALSIWGIDA
jgi:hypothetical protein